MYWAQTPATLTVECGRWHVAVTQISFTAASALPVPTGGSPSNHSRDVVAKIKMKRLNSLADDNIPIYIFILLFAILLSFLATADFRP
ncbi:Branched-chain alpha-ketoacid dehydrogenase kinase/Pyruvate dehydrogenase kinase N-terminal [Penicillium viridicatum]|nr:Branched-chain alpha-ketoacid dehydrogenase kinase/Pyruvate dehydrogenase kinase N-terminal [Penicillium viridicatum]